MASKAKVKDSAPVIGTESQDKALELTMSGETREERRDARNEFMLVEERKARKELTGRADKAVASAKLGRPSLYSPALAHEICERLSTGQSLASVCEGKGMPNVATVFRWLEKEASFRDLYTHARDNMAHAIFDECLMIADAAKGDMAEDGTPNNVNVQRAKLRIDTRFRMAGKLNPKVYSDRMEQLGAVPVTINNNTMNIDARSLDAGQRDSLRQLLLSAQNGAKDS
jgi:hypothetical protein